MSRWHIRNEIDYAPDLYDVNGWLANCTSGMTAKKLKDTHNADCDAYEAQIAELELKLSQGAAYFAELMDKRDRQNDNICATLDRLREAVPKNGKASMLDALIIIGKFHAILYPKETEHGN